MLIANYHAPEEKETDHIVSLLQKFGVKKIILQKEVFDPDLYFKLLSFASIGDLFRMTQYKSLPEESRTAQLLVYPVLMAHDVAGFEEVLVGADQKQHLEYARRLLKRFNRKTGSEFVIPKERIVGGRVGDLRHPENKMSKSSPEGCLFLDDEPEVVHRKLRKANVDDDRYNLETLYEKLVGGKPPTSNLDLKTRIADAVIGLS